MRPVAAALAAVMAILAASPAGAATGERVEVTVGEGEYLVIAGRRYQGPLLIVAGSGGLTVVETVYLDTYLAGIREVPFSWEMAALQAQVVAARSYLAATMRPRAGFDICATTACQVYAGVEAVLGPDGERWRQAVATTSGEILVHEGRPAVTFYSSTTGGRTRNVEHVWPDAEPRPYLVSVPSPGEESPFVRWSFAVSATRMERLLVAAGLARGQLHDVVTVIDDEGPWLTRVLSDGGEVVEDNWTFRGLVNAAAARVMPDLLPAPRPDGRRYPATLLSPEFTIRRVLHPASRGGDLFVAVIYLVEGRGWGHLIGLSQYGAQAMASRGASYPEILAHYYRGLTPTDGSGFLPEMVRVGLVVDADQVLVGGTGPLRVVVDGVEVVAETGPYRFEAAGGAVRVRPPRYQETAPGPGESFRPT